MLGRDHTLLGAVGGVAAGAAAAHAGRLHLPPGQLAAAGAVTAAFALLPDIDEPGSTVSRKLGPASRAVSKVTNKIAGGHRQATHSIVFTAAVFFAVRWLDRYPLTAPIVVYASLALTVNVLIPAGLARKGTFPSLAVPVAAGWAVWRSVTGGWFTQPGHVTSPHLWTWLPWAAALGVFLHLVGDALTVEGVPFAWPWRRHIKVALLGHTDSLREQLVAAGLSIALLALTWIDILSPTIGKQL